MSKLKSKDQLLQKLLYDPNFGSEIRVGLQGDSRVDDMMTEELQAEIKQLLND